MKLEATPHIRGKPNLARWERPENSPRRRARSQSHDDFRSLMRCQVSKMWMRMERRILADISSFRIQVIGKRHSRASGFQGSALQTLRYSRKMQ